MFEKTKEIISQLFQDFVIYRAHPEYLKIKSTQYDVYHQLLKDKKYDELLNLFETHPNSFLNHYAQELVFHMCYENKPDYLKRLLKLGIDVNMLNQDGNSFLMECVRIHNQQNSQLENIQILLDHHANPYHHNREIMSKYTGAFQMALIGQQNEIIELFLKNDVKLSKIFAVNAKSMCDAIKQVVDRKDCFMMKTLLVNGFSLALWEDKEIKLMNYIVDKNDKKLFQTILENISKDEENISKIIESFDSILINENMSLAKTVMNFVAQKDFVKLLEITEKKNSVQTTDFIQAIRSDLQKLVCYDNLCGTLDKHPINKKIKL